MKERLAVIGLAAALTASATACANGAGGDVRWVSAGTEASAGAAPAANPEEALAAAARKLNDQTVTVKSEMAGAMSMTGRLDPRAQKAHMTMEMSASGQSLTMEVIALESDVYLKMSGIPGMPEKWMHLDREAAAGSQLDVMPKDDPAGAGNLIKGLASVERDGERGFKGTLDMTKSPTADEDTLKALGDKAKSVPFTATVDAAGRLTEMKVDMGAVASGVGSLTTTYSGFGKAVNVEKPAAGETMEAPQSVKDLFAK